MRLKQEANPHLASDIITSFTSSEELRLLESRFNSYKSFCIYVNNQLRGFSGNNFVSVPASYNTNIRTISSNPNFSQNNPCHRLPRVGEFAYHISMQLEPESSVEIMLQDVEDMYGNTIPELYRATHTT